MCSGGEIHKCLRIQAQILMSSPHYTAFAYTHRTGSLTHLDQVSRQHARAVAVVEGQC